MLRQEHGDFFPCRKIIEVHAVAYRVERHLPEFIAAAGEDEVVVERIKREKTTRVVTAMRDAFSAMLMTNYQRHIAKMTNDSKDRHVAAAAFAADTDFIVTFNLPHFKPAALAVFRLRAISPDTFLMQLLETDPDTLAGIIRDMERELTRPPRTVTQLLDGLAQVVPVFARAMRAYMDL